MIGAGGAFGSRVASTDVDVAELLAEGVCLVGSAGNFYQTLDILGGPDYDNWFLREGFGQTYYMRGCTPTAVPGVICVGSVSIFNNPEIKSDFSDSGPRVDVYAPGSSIVSAISTCKYLNRYNTITIKVGFSTFVYYTNTRDLNIGMGCIIRNIIIRWNSYCI